MRLERVLVAALILVTPVLAIAQKQDGTNIPEPETLALIAGGAIAFVISRWRRRK